jgi:hypothetical protein
MDWSHSTTNWLTSIKCAKSSVHIANKEHTTHQTRNEVLHRSSHDPPRDTQTIRKRENTRGILTTWKGLQRRKIPTTTQTYYMGPRDRTPPKRTRHFAITTPSTEPKRTRGDAKVCRRTPSTRNYTRIMEPVHCKLLYKEEGQETMPHPGLSTYQQMDKEEQKRIPPNPTNHR